MVWSLSFVPGIREWYRGHASYWIILNDSLRGIKNSGDLAFKINDLVNAGRRLWLVWVWAEGEGLDRNRYWWWFDGSKDTPSRVLVVWHYWLLRSVEKLDRTTVFWSLSFVTRMESQDDMEFIVRSGKLWMVYKTCIVRVHLDRYPPPVVGIFVFSCSNQSRKPNALAIGTFVLFSEGDYDWCGNDQIVTGWIQVVFLWFGGTKGRYALRGVLLYWWLPSTRYEVSWFRISLVCGYLPSVQNKMLREGRHHEYYVAVEFTTYSTPSFKHFVYETRGLLPC